MFHTASVDSGMTYWGGNASQKDKSRLDKNINKAGGEEGRGQEITDTVCRRLVTNKLSILLAGDTHPLRPEFEFPLPLPPPPHTHTTQNHANK